MSPVTPLRAARDSSLVAVRHPAGRMLDEQIAGLLEPDDGPVHGSRVERAAKREQRLRGVAGAARVDVGGHREPNVFRGRFEVTVAEQGTPPRRNMNGDAHRFVAPQGQ